MDGSMNRLRRSRTNKVIAGVAGGLSSYLLIDVVFVRLILIVLCFSGVGMLFYPILWLIMPLEPVGQPQFSQPNANPSPISSPDEEQIRKRSFLLLLGAVGVLCVAMLLPVVGDLIMALGTFLFPLLLIGMGIMLIRRER
jgi:phage shock protein PspC (stress-responsive transcriptional regulator)